MHQAHVTNSPQALQRIRDRAKAIVNYAGMIPFRMPGNTNTQLIQMEVAMLV